MTDLAAPSPASFRPMEAGKADIDALALPAFVSPKLDGVRGMTGVLDTICTRNLNPVRNQHIAHALAHVPAGLDGEILTFTNGLRDPFDMVQAKVATADLATDFTFNVFDCFRSPAAPFTERLREAEALVAAEPSGLVRLVPHVRATSVQQVRQLWAEWVGDECWEGLMLRAPTGIYKAGRSSTREGFMLKLKGAADDEAVVVGVVPEREDHRSLGALICRWRDVTFGLGSGFSDWHRRRLWTGPLLGRTVTFRFEGVGSQGRPRFPRFLGFRYDLAPLPVPQIELATP
ncbi:hypothetical protein [Ancylobacter sp. SL191]|uniref:ATP-dependent DNA ligase n=1 Tax=Ancylobacter sp. SL191 TaxID=2995166 RepID=UPI00226DB752|nr:hypothetical protein [Ancylobacter sp. SL191]WAC26431.1 hypothetical protein OU996_15600 [Ancylobacter sp. SL191]